MTDFIFLEWVIPIFNTYFFQLDNIVGMDNSIATACKQPVERLSAPFDYINESINDYWSFGSQQCSIAL